MPTNKHVHRPLLLSTPVEEGPDVRQLQEHVNRRFRGLNIDREINVDGEFGGKTFNAVKQVALSMGVRGKAQRKLKRGRVSKGTQRLIRMAREATPLEKAAAKRRRRYRRRLRGRFQRAGGELAVERGKRYLGVHEQPAGSNWGGKVEQFIRFTGYTFPVYWCGCFACWVVVKLGGAKGITQRIRLGYAAYITADALAGRNGLRAVPASEARPGDIACMWGGKHIEVVAGHAGGGTVPCLGGNTSTAGESNNGGEVCLNTRHLSDFDAGIVARPTYP